LLDGDDHRSVARTRCNLPVVATKGAPRPSHEVRTLAIEAARELFAAKGYANASLREIAEKAGVAESLLYRNFRTKERLFQVAVLEPFHGIFEGFVNEWAHDRSLGNEELVESVTVQVYELLSRHRDLLIAMLAAESHEENFGNGLLLNQWMADVADAIERQRDVRGLQDADLPVLTRVGLAAVLGVGLLEPWFFPPGPDHPGRDRIEKVLVRFMQYGTIGGPAASPRRRRKPS
jgi:AcrR family transcriptional regulator